MGKFMNKKIVIQDDFGYLRAEYVSRDELNDEEYDGYIPKEFDKVLCLSIVEAKEQGKGYGTRLMEEFIEITQDEPLIYLDPNPITIADMETAGDDFFQRLTKFYNRFGFIQKQGYRMFLNRTDIDVPCPSSDGVYKVEPFIPYKNIEEKNVQNKSNKRRP